jgi:SAM-dependent methyltransferase
MTALRNHREVGAQAAYDALAAGYDLFTAHHDQAAWTHIVLDLALGAGLAGTRVLDVGCGTGSPIVPMVARGYAVMGVDISPAMVALAEAKLGGRANVHVADMRSLPVLGAFDLVWCLCDGINYLLSDDELAAAFAGMHRNLAPGGVVAFDTVGRAAMGRMAGEVHVATSADDVVIHRGTGTGELEPGGHTETHFEHLRRIDGAWRSQVSVHRQRHHAVPGLHDALVRAGLEPVGSWGIDAALVPTQPFDDQRHHTLVTLAVAPVPSAPRGARERRRR